MRTHEREAVELLPRGVANQPDFAKMDLELKEKFEELAKQIAERSNFLAEEKRSQENIEYMEWESKIQTPLDKLRYQMNYVNWYINKHATQFSCCTSKAEKLQAKQDAIQAYTIIQKIITQQDYSIEQQNIDLFKIHNNNIRNGVLLIVGAVIIFAVAMAIVIGGPFVLAAIAGTTLALLSQSTLIPIILAAAALIAVIGASIMGTKGIEKLFIERSSDSIFRDHFSNRISGFFHNDVKTLLPNNDVPAPASEATAVCAQ